VVLKVYSVKMELSTPNPYNSKFTIDVEIDVARLKSEFPNWKDYSWYVEVVGRYGGHGVLLAEKSTVVDMSVDVFRKAITFNAHPLYCYDGISVWLSFCHFSPSLGEEICGSYKEVFVPSSSVLGYSDYLSWRAQCLSVAKWKYEVTITTPERGIAPGGFVAIYSAVLDTSKKTVTIDVQVDGTTRYYDIYSCWFGLSGYLFKIAGIGRSRVTIDFSDPYYWDLLQKGGLWVQPRDYSGFLVDGFSIPFDQLERVAELKGTIVRVDPPDGSKIEVGKSVPIRVDVRNDSSVAVEAYPLVVVRGIKTGTEYARLTASSIQMNPGEVKTFTATEAFKMPSEDVEVTVVLYMRQALSYQWHALASSLRYCPREALAGALCRGTRTAA
jgi:hypothetical protein